MTHWRKRDEQEDWMVQINIKGLGGDHGETGCSILSTIAAIVADTLTKRGIKVTVYDSEGAGTYGQCIERADETLASPNIGVILDTEHLPWPG